MALDSYAGLKAAVSTWTDGADLSATDSDLITLAEAEINARLSDAVYNGAAIRPMITRSSVIINAEYVDLPDADYTMILPVSLEITSLSEPYRISYTSPDNAVDLRQQEDCTGIPRHYTVIGEGFRFFPSPDASYTAEFIRYTRLTPLSDENPSNWLLARHPNAYLYAALAQAELLGWNDERVSSFAALFDNAMEGVSAAYPTQADQRPLYAALPLDCRLPC